MVAFCLFIFAPTGQSKAAVNAYVIGAGDVLEISVWKDDAMSRQVVVLPDGLISFPLVGEVIAAGKTVKEFKAELVEKIKPFVPDPVVTMIVSQVNSLQIYVIGRVNKPGRFKLNSSVNVLQALAMAGGLNPFAKKNQIKIIRERQGVSEVFPFDYELVAKETKLEQNISLKRGDVVLVP